MDSTPQRMDATAQLLGAVFSSSPIGLATFDGELRHLDVNPAYLRLTGRSADELAGRRPDQTIPRGGDIITSGLEEALESGGPTEIRIDLPAEQPHEGRHYVGIAWVVRTAAGAPIGAVMMRDITERTRTEIARQEALSAEQVLRRDAERQRDFIRMVLDNAPMAISMCEGPDFRLAIINDFALRLVGVDRDALIGRPISETFPEAFEQVKHHLERVYYQREIVKLPERLVPLPDGRHLWSYSCYAPVCDRQGAPLGVVSLSLDVTTLKQAQVILESQKRIVEMIAMGASLPAVLDTVAGTIADSMPDLLPAILLVAEGGRHLRYASAPLLPSGFSAVIDGLPIGPNCASCGTAAYLGQRVTVYDITTDPLWGAYRDLAATYAVRACCSTPIVGSAGSILGTLALYSKQPGAPSDEQLRLVDLIVRTVALAVERQAAEDERARLLDAERRARRDAERASRSKDEFVATLSHELRTPLNAILGWTRMLRAGELDVDATARALDSIERNTRAQTQLVEDLLDISRIITGKLRLDVRSVELTTVVETAIDAFRPAAEAKSIRLLKVLDPRAAPISGDPDRLQQVVWNLLSNAIKFTPKGGRVQIRLERINSHVEIVVSDSGQGIPPDLLPSIFDRFSQGTESGAKTGGLGLGLAIARHLVELHGGTIHAVSDGIDAGATFTIKLPLMAARAERAAHEVHPTAGGGNVAVRLPRLTSVRVLVVEDDEDGREIVTRILLHAGAEVRAVEGAADAYTVLRDWKPDILISDIEMPGEDGYALISRLRREPGYSPRELPAIALTAYARVEDRIKALAAGFQMHVPKPVEPAELIAVIKALVPQAEAGA